MKAFSNKNFFEPRARLLLQLGDKLIKNENIALLELIKNAYDADAKNVIVRLEGITSQQAGRIDIIDDGEGMDISIIENSWLEPGSDNKAILFAKGIRTKRFNRLPIGEKGIGRFGVHKLSNKIELISRREGEEEVVVRINWADFSKHKYLKDAKIEVFVRTPEYFIRNRTGTRIILSDLRTPWDRRMIREFYKSVFTLNSPFKRRDDFQVDIQTDTPELLSGLPTWDQVKDFALFHFKCTLKGNSISDFTYRFIPWKSMPNISPRKIDMNDSYVYEHSTITVKSKDKKNKEVVIDLEKNYGTAEKPLHIGEISFEGYIFDRDKNVLELSMIQGTSLLKEYLDEQGGIRVYRDNVRVNEYGERSNDWLNLDSRRVNLPTKRISNNIILGVIDLKAEQSTALIEKTNREGFIENEAFHDFGAAILYTLNLVEVLREYDKSLIREKTAPQEHEDFVLSPLSKLRILVDNKISDGELKEDIHKHINRIEEEYNHIQEVLLTSAGAGLTLGFGMHEIQKLVANIKATIESTPEQSRIVDLVEHLDNLIENYSTLLRQSDKKQENIKTLIDGSLFNFEYRFEDHKILVERMYLNRQQPFYGVFSKRLLLGAIMNILDNSIYWLDRKQRASSKVDPSFEKKIFIDLIHSPDGYIELIIADNGPGLTLPTSQIIKPFISTKPDGMGLGLHIVKEIMYSQSGLLEFPNFDEYDIPIEYKKGTIIVLKIKASSNDIPQ